MQQGWTCYFSFAKLIVIFIFVTPVVGRYKCTCKIHYVGMGLYTIKICTDLQNVVINVWMLCLHFFNIEAADI